jgi:deoxyribodipyrimidine photolyase-related protein
MVSSEHFYTTRSEVATLFAGQKTWLMERFYRQMRTKHQILMLDDKRPVEGKWNFDQDNRKAWSGTPAEPADWRVRHDHSALWASIEAAGVRTFGTPNAAHFAWPLNRAEALTCLADFIERALPHFGDFQDALSTKGWRLFHSLLSFALNTKMLHPREVVERAQQAWRDQHITIAAAEGFIRQILGWREYIRGVYWGKMPDYGTQNYFAQHTALPKWFWTGQTKMRCLEHSIGQSLEHAYGHHIQRLMVIGNFSLLAGLDPEQVHQWYLFGLLVKKQQLLNKFFWLYFFSWLLFGVF